MGNDRWTKLIIVSLIVEVSLIVNVTGSANLSRACLVRAACHLCIILGLYVLTKSMFSKGSTSFVYNIRTLCPHNVLSYICMYNASTCVGCVYMSYISMYMCRVCVHVIHIYVHV